MLTLLPWCCAEAPWYKFDDDHVYQVKQRLAVDGSFGGEHDSGTSLFVLRLFAAVS
jgi:hypothetical protein